MAWKSHTAATTAARCRQQSQAATVAGLTAFWQQGNSRTWDNRPYQPGKQVSWQPQWQQQRIIATADSLLQWLALANNQLNG
jgi:hypothetical protein